VSRTTPEGVDVGDRACVRIYVHNEHYRALEWRTIGTILRTACSFRLRGRTIGSTGARTAELVDTSSGLVRDRLSLSFDCIHHGNERDTEEASWRLAAEL
jgi:hypothetical protein